MRKSWTLVAALLVAANSLVAAQPAAAVTNFTVTVVASGGAAENSGWTYANGEITPTASVSINASSLVSKLASGPLVVYSGRILVNASVIHSTANSLTFKSQGNIIVGGGLTVQSQGGDVIFHADSDANNTGHVRFGWDANCAMGNVTTNGGAIVVGGGANPLTGTTSAQNNDAANISCPGGTPPLAGVGFYNFTFNADGGNISVRGGSPNLGGSLSVRSVNISGSGGLIPTFQTSGAGTVTIYGDGSSIGHNNAWGIATGSVNVTTDQGAITFEARGNASGPTNARGMSIGGASNFTSTSGDVSFLDRTNGALAGYTGINLGAAINVTTNGDFSVQADEISQGGALTLDVDSASIGSFTTSSFTNVYSTGVINAANSNNLTIGSPGNTSAITLAAAVTSGGPISITASTVTVNAALTATGSPVTFVTSAGVTQNAAITASTMNLAGTATYNPQSFTVTGGSTLTPPDIALSSANETATIGWAIRGYTVSNAGGAADSYSISPAVGNGLNFNTSTGALTGKPVIPANAVTYTVTATNGAGSDTATFTITALAAPARPIFTFDSKPVISANGQGLVLQGKNLDGLVGIKVAGKDATVTKNAAGELVLQMPAGIEGAPDLEVIHANGTVVMQGFIKVLKPYEEKRTLQVSSFTGGQPSKSALAALQASYSKGLPANIVSCVATVASDASASAIKLAEKRAKATCQAMSEYSSFINRMDVQVSKTGAAGSKPSLAVTFDRTLTGR